jgi:hypothetical protein
MCTSVWFVLPFDADTAAVDALTVRHKVGRGIVEDGRRTDVTGERMYGVRPWKMCHCGWDASDFAPLMAEALEKRATPWIGVLTTEGAPELSERIRMEPSAFAALKDGDERQDVLYVVEPDRSPRPVHRRHGPRRRSSRKPGG